MEQAYEKILNDGWERDSYPDDYWGPGGKYDEYDIIDGVKYYHNDPDHPDNRRSSFVKKEGDVFKGKDGRKWIRVRKADGSLGVKPHPDNPDAGKTSFTQKEGDVFKGKDGRMWIRVIKKDGSLGVRPYKENK